MSLNKRTNIIMKKHYDKTNNGYLYTVHKGIESDFFGQVISAGKNLPRKEKIQYLKDRGLIK